MREPGEDAKPSTDGQGEPAVEQEEDGTPSHEGTAIAARTPRDYSGLDENEVPLFKKMGDVAFATLKPKWLEYKKLETEHNKLKEEYDSASKSSFFEHPDSYQLTPEFQRFQGQLQLSQFELGHWKKQLAAIRANEKVSSLIGYSDKGVPQYEELEPSPELEADILDALNQARAIHENTQRDLNTFKTSFSSQHKSFMTKLDDVRKEIFKGVDQTKLKTARDRKLEVFPSYLRGRPEFQVIAELWAIIDGFNVLNRSQQAQNITQKAVQKTAANGGPRTAQVQTGAAKANTVGAAVEAIERYKQKSGY